MECSVDVFVGNSTIVDSEIYQLWVDGNSAREAADILQQRGILQQCCANMDLLMSDVLDHYRTFHMLERLLHTPLKLTEEWTFQMELNTQKMLIEKYTTVTTNPDWIHWLKFILFHTDITNWTTLCCGRYSERSFRRGTEKIWTKSAKKRLFHWYRADVSSTMLGEFIKPLKKCRVTSSTTFRIIFCCQPSYQSKSLKTFFCFKLLFLYVITNVYLF